MKSQHLHCGNNKGRGNLLKQQTAAEGTKDLILVRTRALRTLANIQLFSSYTIIYKLVAAAAPPPLASGCLQSAKLLCCRASHSSNLHWFLQAHHPLIKEISLHVCASFCTHSVQGCWLQK